MLRAHTAIDNVAQHDDSDDSCCTQHGRILDGASRCGNDSNGRAVHSFGG